MEVWQPNSHPELKQKWDFSWDVEFKANSISWDRNLLSMLQNCYLTKNRVSYFIQRDNKYYYTLCMYEYTEQKELYLKSQHRTIHLETTLFTQHFSSEQKNIIRFFLS